MSETAIHVQIYQEIISVQPGLTVKTTTFENVEPLPQPTLHNPIIDSNPLMLNLEVFIVAFLLLALPILIYLAYRYGKKMGRKEHGPNNPQALGAEILRRRFSQESTSSNSFDRVERSNSKNSSTSSSPALGSARSAPRTADMNNENSSPVTSEKIKRESSVQTEDEKMEDFSLGETSNGQAHKNCQLVAVNNAITNAAGNENFSVMYTYSCGATGAGKEADREMFDEKLKLHSHEGQVVRKEVKIGINVEKKGEHFQKTEIKELRTIYDPQSDIPEQKAKMMKENYESSPIFNRIFSAPAKPAVELEQRAMPLAICAGEVKPVESKKPASQGPVTRKNSEIVANKESTNHDTREERTRSVQPAMIESVVEKYGVPDETGKFHKIFKDVEWIGEGSFGEVYKVVHRLDGKIYAVKKVKLKLGRFEELKKESKVFREVFAMTDLHHPNIVRYSTCWVEIEWDKENQETKEKSDKSKGILDLEPVNLGDISENEEGSDEDVSDGESEPVERSRNSDMGFEWDVSEKEKTRKKEKKMSGKLRGSLKKKNNEKGTPGLKRKNSNLLIRTLSKSFIEEEAEEVSKNSSLSRVESMCEVPGCKLYLYIQMEYCAGQSLKYYLENSKRKVIKEKVLQMFRKLLEGVHSIHSRGILHRDLKPANIFLDGNENVKIGDFGLASLDKYDEQLEGLTTKELIAWKSRKLHSLKVGTPMYTSPEQENGGHYDHKTDIFSLGLIFYEMLVSFSTHHERYQHFGSIRETHELPESFRKQYAAESEIILRMTDQLPANRPAADQLMAEVDKLLEVLKTKQSS